MNFICAMCGSELTKVEGSSYEYTCLHKDNIFRTIIDSNLYNLAMNIKTGYDYNFYMSKNIDMYKRLGFSQSELDNNSLMWICKLITFMRFKFNIVNLNLYNLDQYEQITMDNLNDIASEFIKEEQYPIISKNTSLPYSIYNRDECVVLLKYMFNNYTFVKATTNLPEFREVRIDVTNQHTRERYGKIVKGYFLDYYFYGLNNSSVMAKILLSTGEIKYEFIDQIRFLDEAIGKKAIVNLIQKDHVKVYGKQQKCSIHTICNIKGIDGFTEQGYIVEMRDGGLLVVPSCQVNLEVS